MFVAARSVAPHPVALPSGFCLRRRLCSVFTVTLWLGALGLLAGCSRIHKEPEGKYVYLTAKQDFLRDRVAAVSNRTGEVQNGEKLVVLDRGRHMLKVRSPSGAVGWLKEGDTADQALADRFDDLKTGHAKDPVVASAATRDEVYLHIAPGRETDKFFRLAEGEKLSLLERATVAKPVAPGTASSAAAAAGVAGSSQAKGGSGNKSAGKSAAGGTAKQEAGAPAAGKSAAGNVARVAGGVPPPDSGLAPPPAAMEDWWLVRDGKGDTGWIYSRLIDVDEPDALARYAEGQRIVGAYLLAKADDPESNVVSNGQTVTSIPEYVTVLSPPKAGLPYDFDQVRVFTWNVKKHRYETAFRERNIAGYLPVVMSTQTDPYSKGALAAMPLPAFSYRVLAADSPIPAPDPVTGFMKPGRTIVKTLRLEGSNCRRLLPPGQPAPAEAHPNPEPEKKAKRKR